jgi:hypothetical protein
VTRRAPRATPRLTTVPAQRAATSSIPQTKPRPPALPARPSHKAPPKHSRPPIPARTVARIIDDGDRSLLDVVDNLLNSGVMLNADLMLALANVDLVYVRLSALLVAADRVFPPDGEA